MTKEDFKKKYHGKSVKIEASMQVNHFGDIADKPRRIQEICKFMGLETHQVTVPAPYPLITILDKQLEFRTNSEPLTPMSEEEFLANFKEVHEELEFGRAKKLLADLKVECVSMTKLGRSSQNMKQAYEEGFIQRYTSNDVSIWWHPMGRRLLFVRGGEGVFELTDKSE